MGCQASSPAAENGSAGGNKYTVRKKSTKGIREEIVRAFYPSFHVHDHKITPELVSLVSNHWRAIREGELPSFKKFHEQNEHSSAPVLFYDTFYDRLFEIAPECKKLFKGGISKQGPALFKMINAAVTLLDNNDTTALTQALTDLAVRHNEYNAKPVHYELVGRSLVYTMQVLTEDDTTGKFVEAVAAWVQVYSFMMTVMLKPVVKHHLDQTT